MVRGKILIVDDEQGIRELLASEFSRLAYSVSCASNGEEALTRIENERFDIIISDMKMPKLSGLELLKKVKAAHPATEVIIITGYATIENALEVMKAGAYDFVQKPFNIEELVLVTERALEKSELKTLVALYESSNAIFSNTKLEELLPGLIKLIKKNMLADDAAIFLSDDNGELHMTSASFHKNSENKTIFTALAEKINSTYKYRKEPLLLNTQQLPEFLEGIVSDSDADMKSLITYPITLKGNTLGFLVLSKNLDASAFSEADLNNLSIFILQIAQAINNIKLYETLELKATEMRETFEALSKANAKLDILNKIPLEKFKNSAFSIVKKIDNLALKNPKDSEISDVQKKLHEYIKHLDALN
jgi:DNA-binding response OmpR family regulator